MEIAIASAAALALMFAIAITVAAHYRKNSLVIWFTYATIMFATLGPFLYWQKRENDRQPPQTPALQPESKPAQTAPSQSPPPKPLKSEPAPTPTAKPRKGIGSGPSPKPMGYGSGARPGGYPTRPNLYDHIKWTDYTEDYFYDAIWRWKYRPEMGNQTPRDIKAWCPECTREVLPTDYVISQRDGDRVAILLCSHCIPERPYRIPGFVTDHCDGIRTLIAEKLRNGQWEEVVKRQIDVRPGRI